MPNETKNNLVGSDKLRELVLYICLASEGDETIFHSAVLLHKPELSAQEEQWAQELDLTGVAELLRS